MYYRRLKIFLAMICMVLAVWVARLATLQLVYGNHYLEQARENLITPSVSLPTERGRILDRHRRLLAVDEPETVVTVEYGILVGDPYYLATGSYRRGMSRAKAEELAEPRRQRYEELLREVGLACGQQPEELEARRQEIIQQVQTIRAAVSRRLGRPTAIPAERIRHVLIRDISTDAPSRLNALLSEVRGIAVESRRRRSYPVGKGMPDVPESMAHLVGYEGAVTGADLADDPFADDDRRRYLPGDERGLTGIERSAEATLRGWRGRFQQDRDGQVLVNELEVPGGPVSLAIDSQLQYYLFRVLARHVERSPWPCGGAVVVINVGDNIVGGQRVGDGDILAMVSYPSFDPNNWRLDWATMVRDEYRRPMLFRAVGALYPPGSIAKPAVVAGALHDGKVRLDEPVDCKGWFVSPTHNAFRCWNPHGHGQPLLPADALKYSCNVYCYELGERLGMGRLTHWLGQFGCGSRLDIGLAEERAGPLPSPAYMALNFGGYSRGDVRNVAIGQGRLLMTPLAAANMMATIARNGVHVRPTLLLGGPRPQPVPLGIHPAHMAAIREGMYRVVNEDGGTARKHAYMDNVKLAGKTGSATASPLVVGGEVVNGRRVGGQLFPPSGLVDDHGRPTKPAHAWFGGFAPADKPTVAIVCIIEYGMNGGKTAGPLARDVVQLCLNMGYVPGRPEDVREVEGVGRPVVQP